MVNDSVMRFEWVMFSDSICIKECWLISIIVIEGKIFVVIIFDFIFFYKYIINLDS